MDKISDRNPSKSEVIGRCGGMNRQKSNAKKTTTFVVLKLISIKLKLTVFSSIIDIKGIYQFYIAAFNIDLHGIYTYNITTLPTSMEFTRIT